MSVPGFSDLGKNIKEVLNTGYQYGKTFVNLNMKTARKDFEVDNSYSMNHNASTIHGNTTAKLKLCNYGILIEKWDTDGKLNFRYTNNKLYDGLDLTATVNYTPVTSISTLKCGANYKNDYLNIGGSISNNMDLNDVNVSAKAVVALKDALIGYRVGYDTATRALTKSEIGISYKFPNIGIHFNCSPGFTDDFGVSTVFKVTDNFDAAMSTGCIATHPFLTSGGSAYGMYNEFSGEWIGSVGGRYQINDDTIVRAKIDNNLQLSTSVVLPISEDIHITTAFAIDLTDPLGGNNKVGLTLDINS